VNERQGRAREIATAARRDYAAAQVAARNHTVWWVLLGIGAIVLAGVAGYAGLAESNANLAGWLGVAAAVFAAIDNALEAKEGPRDTGSAARACLRSRSAQTTSPRVQGSHRINWTTSRPSEAGSTSRAQGRRSHDSHRAGCAWCYVIDHAAGRPVTEADRPGACAPCLAHDAGARASTRFGSSCGARRRSVHAHDSGDRGLGRRECLEVGPGLIGS